MAVSYRKKFRMTNQRRVIIEELKKSKDHPGADEIYVMVRKVLPHISLGTVYRNLEILHTKGQIKKIDLEGNQMRFDGDLTEHYHVSCIVCNRIDDISAGVVKKLEVSTEEIDDYHIIGHKLHFFGVCKDCNSDSEYHEKNTLSPNYS